MLAYPPRDRLTSVTHWEVLSAPSLSQKPWKWSVVSARCSLHPIDVSHFLSPKEAPLQLSKFTIWGVGLPRRCDLHGAAVISIASGVDGDMDAATESTSVCLCAAGPGVLLAGAPVLASAMARVSAGHSGRPGGWSASSAAEADVHAASRKVSARGVPVGAADGWGGAFLRVGGGAVLVGGSGRGRWRSACDTRWGARPWRGGCTCPSCAACQAAMRSRGDCCAGGSGWCCGAPAGGGGRGAAVVVGVALRGSSRPVRSGSVGVALRVNSRPVRPGAVASVVVWGALVGGRAREVGVAPVGGAGRFCGLLRGCCLPLTAGRLAVGGGDTCVRCCVLGPAKTSSVRTL